MAKDVPEEIHIDEIESIILQKYVGKTLRIFISYSSIDKVLAGQIKEHLQNYGLEVFVAHDDIKPSSLWREEVIRNLIRCDIFLALLTKNFRNSEWTDQETGMALALKKFPIVLEAGIKPYGFLNDYQEMKIRIHDIKKSCEKIIEIIESKDVMKDALKDCLIGALFNASSYQIAHNIMQVLSNFDEFSVEQINHIFRSAIVNGQVKHSFGCTPILNKLYLKYGYNLHPLLNQRYKKS